MIEDLLKTFDLLFHTHDALHLNCFKFGGLKRTKIWKSKKRIQKYYS